MRVTLLTYGSRGDVEPFLVLATALIRSGHDVLLAAPSNFENFAAKLNVPFVALPGDTQAVLASPEGAVLLEKGDIRAFLSNSAKLMECYVVDIEEISFRSCQQADIIVCGLMCLEDTVSISEKLNIPYCILNLFPVLPSSRELANILVTTKNLRLGFLNRFTHALYDLFLWREGKHHIQAFRKRLGLAPFKGPVLKKLARLKVPVLHAYSPSLVKLPREWRVSGMQSGFLNFMPEEKDLHDQQPSPALVEFINGGSQPIFFGFGSMPVHSVEKVLDQIATALTALNRRAIFASGWSEAASVAKKYQNIHVVKGANFEWLFRQCAVVVHQGGAGTTHTSLRAGVATIICPFLADQFYWGSRVKALGVGATVPFAKLNAQNLRAALEYALSSEVAARAKVLGRGMVAEAPGAPLAVKYLEELAAKIR